MSGGQPADMTEGRDDYGLRERQLLLMHATDQLILDHSNTLAKTLEFIVTQTQKILDARYVDILFLYPDGFRNEISTDHADIGRFVPFDYSIAGLVLSGRTPVIANDIQININLRDRYIPRPAVDPVDQSPRTNVMAVELTLDGEVIGVLNIESTSDGGFNEAHLGFAIAVASQISTAFAHATLFDEDNLLLSTGSLLVSGAGADNDAIMRQVLDAVLSTLNSLTFLKPDAAEILLADPQDDRSLVVAYSTNSADIGIRVDIESSVSGEAFRTRRTVLLQRAVERSDFHPIMPGMRCEMAIPISLGGNQYAPFAVLNLESSRENAFSNAGRVLAERFSRRLVNIVAMTKIRADIDSELQDQLMVLAADQALNAVHRINNYVGSVQAIALDLLEDLDSPDPPDQGDLVNRLRMITSNAEHALEIPDELRKRIGTPRESTDVNAQVKAGLTAVRIPKHIELVTDLAPGLPNIPCAALDLVVENLVLNAVKAMQRRPGPLRVATWLDDHLHREPFIVVSVQDTGVGMTGDELARLFEPRQVGRRGSGLGFGMMWVRSWVRRSQGLIEVDSQPGRGTTVNIRFQIDPRQTGTLPPGGGSR
jgi:signal transduction histidine kinase